WPPTNPEAPVRKTLSVANCGADGFLDRSGSANNGGGFVAAVRHAVVARLVLAASVLRPVRLVQQLFVGLGVAFFAHQVAGALPAEHRVARDAPRRALEIDLALQKVQIQRTVVQAPLLALVAGERGLEDLA